MSFLINRKITITMLFVALTMLGYVSYRQLSVELLPNAELPMLYVQVSSDSDVDPSYMESQVTIPLEGAISKIDGVERIESRSSSRQSSIRIDFKNNVNLKYTAVKLQEKVNEASADLPEGFRVSIQKVDVNRASNNFMTLQVLGSGGVDRVRNLVDTEVVPDLENIDGVASVTVYGGRQKAIEIQMDVEACKALDITAAKINSILTQNAGDRAFTGYVNDINNKYFVHVNSEYGSVADIENIVVAPGPVFLKDVATIFFDMKQETTLSRVNGKEAVSVSVINDAQVNLIDLSHRVIHAIGQLNEKLLPLDLEITVQNNSAEVMEDNINQIAKLALIGGLLAVIILWFFLKNLRLVLLIALSIPISIYAAFNMFYAFGITINSLTLVGMALAVGMLLDNSIVVLENIYRHSALGESAEDSVIVGSREVRRAIIAATLTTITVFLPFAFSDNFIIRLIGEHIGVSIISTLLFSLLVALLFVPMATYVVLRRKLGNSVFYEKISIRQRPIQIYITLLKMSLRRPAVTIFGAIALLVVVYALTMAFSSESKKEVNTDRLNIVVTTFGGSTLESTDLVVRSIEERLEDIPEKKELVSSIQESQAVLTLILHEDYRKKSKRKMSEIRSDVQGRLSDIERASINVSAGMSGNNQGGAGTGIDQFMRMMGMGANRERIIIRGSDYETMDLVAEDLRYYMGEMESVSNSWRSYQGGRQPEINLEFDQILLNSYNISRANVASGFTGLTRELASGSTLKVGDRKYDIIIRDRLTEEQEKRLREQGQRMKTVDDLRALRIPNSAGGLHDLQSLATINYGRGMAQIIRVDQDKQIEIFYTFGLGAEESNEILETYRAEIDALVEGYNTPVGIALEVVHEEDEFADFKFLIVAAFIFIFMILASVFESLVTPLVMLFAIPLAAIGSLLALLLTGTPLMNANTLMGFLILLGVVTNNGILLIDYANILRSQGYNRNRALIMSGLSRLRPILITSITTIVAMIPMAMGGSEYAGAIGAPFAITVIGGLSLSSVLTLILIPTVCVGLENSIKWYRTLGAKMYVVHGILFVAGVIIILLKVYGLMSQILYLMMLVVLIPGVTYFVKSSLRSAKSKFINRDDEISIKVDNLVKIYDRPSLFARQWSSGINIRKRLGLSVEYRKLADFRNILWQVAVLGFLIYFAYFFLEKGFWIFLISFIIYGLVVSLWSSVYKYLSYKVETGAINKPRRIRVLNSLVYWGVPVVMLVVLFNKLGSPGFVLLVALVWMIVLAIRRGSAYIYNNNINIERVEGRFARLKRSFFRLVKSIPVIGKQQRPFKALRGVSFEIKTGMFGLLGPNGAGKSTLIRIVCGILKQSYGTIWINGLDTNLHREELQSLIGFLPQEFGTYENMTSREFLDYQAILKGILDPEIRHERIEYVLKAVHMYERKDAKIGSFSGGMKQRIGIALILLHLPRILVVDEPTAGLDPRERIRFRNLLVELSRDRIVIFSTHIIEDISSSCNQVVVVNKGELKYFGVPRKMVHIAENKVWQFYISEADFEAKLDKSLVVHHIQDRDMIRVRYISAEKPQEDAVAVEANLEDAYLCLLKNI